MSLNSSSLADEPSREMPWIGSISSPAIVEFLSSSDAYPDRPQRVERMETHISWVFLTPRFAYKLKKPVKFDFLDFTTLEQRHAACLEELTINRRLAKDIYLDLVAVTQGADGRLSLGGAGRQIDWLVKMVRLPAENSLDRLILENRLAEADIEALTATLVHFYRRLPPLTIKTPDYRANLELHIRANRRELLTADSLPSELIKRVHSGQLRQLRFAPEKFDHRVCDGRIVDGHGDLRPEHIYFAPQPVVIDGIEFNPEFRRIDVLDELSFLAMECEILGAEPLGRHLIDAYCRAANDLPPAGLLPFYRSYRACVRAKVAVLRGRQWVGESRRIALEIAGRYLALADRVASELGGPWLIVVRGLSGRGKSVLSEALAESLGFDLLQTDVIRREQYGLDAAPASYGQAKYETEARSRVYDELFRRAAEKLQRNISVILDGAFLAFSLRQTAQAVAEQNGAKCFLLHCDCRPELARQRVLDRQAKGGCVSEIQPEMLAEQASREEADPPGWTTCRIDSSLSLAEMMQSTLDYLRPHSGWGG